MSSENKKNLGTILVFGMPRSGTTWLGKIFDSQGSTLYRHEPDSWSRFQGVPLFPATTDAAKYSVEIVAFNQKLPEINAAKVCAKQPIFPKNYLSGAQLSLMKSGAFLSQLAGRAGLVIPVFGALNRIPANSRVVWKSIESLGRLGVVMNCLDEARAVHIIRHPCGYVASVLRGESRQKFEDNQGASEDYGVLEMLLGTDIGRKTGMSIEDLRAFLPEQRLAWRWAVTNEKAIRDVTAIDRCKLVRYEDLCLDPAATTKELFEFAGLKFDRQSESFVSASTGQQDDAYYSVFKNPVSAMNRWNKELDAAQIESVMSIVEPFSCGRLFQMNAD